MKTVLIPVDFSAASDNALAYAAEFVKDAPVSRIILLKSCYVSIYAQLLPSAHYVQVPEEDMRRERNEIQEQMAALSKSMKEKVGEKVQVEIAISESSLTRAINEVVEQEHPELVIAGSDTTPYSNQSYIGNQVIKIAKTSTISVLVVPQGYHFRPVKRVLLACDFKTILRSHALTALETRYNWLNPQLLVLNVSGNKVQDDDQRTIVEENLKALLKNYQYEMHYITSDDILHGITDFADKNDVQMIIALPGYHSFLYQLTHNSITEGLSANANHPVLILK